MTIFGYQLTPNADIIEPKDEEIIQMAKAYQVAPIMLLSSLTYEGVGSAELAYKILYNEEIVERYIENILNILKRKGLYGVSFIYSYLDSSKVDVYCRFTEKITKRLNSEGYSVFVSIPPLLKINNDIITFENIDYSEIGRLANQTIVMEYNWGYNLNPPMPVASIYTLGLFLDYLITLVPKEKMSIGLSLIGYNWLLPHLLCNTRANALTYDSVINLAYDTGSEIQFDEISQTPFFEYTINMDGIPRQHILWFVDARSINALASLVTEYNCPGISVWNIMTYLPQMWLIINTQYEIETLIPYN